VSRTGHALGLRTGDGRVVWPRHHFVLLGCEPAPAGAAAREVWLSRIHPDDRPTVETEWARAEREGDLYRAVYRVERGVAVLFTTGYADLPNGRVPSDTVLLLRKPVDGGVPEAMLRRILAAGRHGGAGGRQAREGSPEAEERILSAANAGAHTPTLIDTRNPAPAISL